MKKDKVSRRRFLEKSAVAGAAGIALSSFSPVILAENTNGKLALKGGKPVKSNPFPSWPMIKKNDEEGWMEVLHDKNWCRLGAPHVKKFEEVWAQQIGTKHALATSCGTTALQASLNALEVSPGDEVIVPPYTFVATINVVLLQYALPVFVDTDPETFQINADLIEEKITERTRVIIPVHLGGNVCDLDKILAIGKKHNIPVLEDACQAHTGEWRHKRVGGHGCLGCFSYQVTKNLSSGEGGSIVSNDDTLIERCHSFHNNGRGTINYGYSYGFNGTNSRMTEFQGRLLLEQITRLEIQSRRREANAKYLTKQLNEIPGIQASKEYGYHLYMFRNDKKAFAGAQRNQFLKALQAEGVPCASGYTPLNKEPFIKNTLSSRGYSSVYPKERIDKYLNNIDCPANDKLCNEEGVWFFQQMLLGSKKDMDQIADAIRKIQANASLLAKA